MPLVEYDASSSDEDDADQGPPEEATPAPPASTATAAPPPPPPPPSRATVPSHLVPAPQGIPSPPPDLQKRILATSSRVQLETMSDISSPSIQLPDVSLLLSAPFSSTNQIGSSDHSSRVAAAMAENASRKRASNGSVPQHPQFKHHRGSSPLSKPLVDVKSGLLIPPQLHGRSNVVTEDMSKLFVHKRTEPHQ